LAIYNLVGIVNAFVGLGSVLALTYFGLIAEVANFFGYVIGVCLSYFLNSKFIFKAKRTALKALKFTIAMGIAYCLNLGFLSISYRIYDIDVYLAQCLAGVIYTVSGFLLCRYFVFLK
jgi:putative flippase GtrA